MLSDVVADGTGTKAQIPGYKVAGKTGTAQKALPNGGGYSKTNYVASFIGMVPARDPQLVVAVVVDQPHPYWGGTVAAPAFARSQATPCSASRSRRERGRPASDIIGRHEPSRSRRRT